MFERWLSQNNTETCFEHIAKTDKTHCIVAKDAICKHPAAQSTKLKNNKKRKFGSIFINE